jgi:hypothetical protein
MHQVLDRLDFEEFGPIPVLHTALQNVFSKSNVFQSRVVYNTSKYTHTNTHTHMHHGVYWNTCKRVAASISFWISINRFDRYVRKVIMTRSSGGLVVSHIGTSYFNKYIQSNRVIVTFIKKNTYEGWGFLQDPL